MSFMQGEIVYDSWVEIDGPNGGEVIPTDVCGSLPDYDEFAAAFEESGRAEFEDVDEAYKAYAFQQVSGYSENSECYEIAEREAWGARLSAPGYLDCTEWSLYDSEAEAKRGLCEMYDLCPVCLQSVDDDWSSNPACRFHHTKE